MLYSTERILTTHAGSLPRPADLCAMVVAKTSGQPYDQAALDARLREAVAETARRRVECGLDIVNDGELSKFNFTNYVRERIAGYEDRPNTGRRRLAMTARDERKFSGYFESVPRARARRWPKGRAARLGCCGAGVRRLSQACATSWTFAPI